METEREREKERKRERERERERELLRQNYIRLWIYRENPNSELIVIILYYSEIKCKIY